MEALRLDDATLDVEVTANRGDLLSHVGVARELASEGGGTVVLPPLPGDPGESLTYEEGAPVVTVGDVSIEIEDPELCSRYLGAVIRGVKVGPSPGWLQERLRGAGARPINNVVDATNYVMLELGQPLHAFDLNRLAGAGIVVRRPRAGETRFVTLDSEERSLGAEMLMICDQEKPVAIGGVMGGLDSEVEETTQDVLLECALFDPKSIRSTRKALQMSTDASYRYERGVDPAGMRRAVERCVAIILATAGGRVDGPVLDCCPKPFEPATIDLRLSRIEHLLGVPVAAAEVEELLTPLGFVVGGETDGVLEVGVPGFRSYDVTREVDLIEEVARTYGYDRFPDDLSAYRPGTVADHPLFALEDELRDRMVGLGFFEAQTPAFAPVGEGSVEVANPVTSTEPMLRESMIPSLLRRVERNLSHGNRDVRLFEIGTVFSRAASGEPPLEETRIGVVFTGRSSPPHWSREDELFEVWDLKALLEDLVAAASRQAAADAAAGERAGPWEGGTCFLVGSEGAAAGWGGRVSDSAVDVPAWASDVWALEVVLPSELPSRPVARYQPLPQYPGTERDLALLVPREVPASEIAGAIRESAGEHLQTVELFDVYEGEGVADGARSLAFRLRFRSRKRTLKDKEVDKATRAVLARLEEMGVGSRG